MLIAESFAQRQLIGMAEDVLFELIVQAPHLKDAQSAMIACLIAGSASRGMPALLRGLEPKAGEPPHF